MNFKNIRGKNLKIKRDYPCLIFFAEMMNMKTDASNNALLAMGLFKAMRPSVSTAVVLLSESKIRLQSTKNQKSNQTISLILNQKNSQFNGQRLKNIGPTIKFMRETRLDIVSKALKSRLLKTVYFYLKSDS